ncbi:hypothetical protein A8B83_02360 [Rhodobacteraceae bacterium EhC02]|nr:hypothetical protein A8B83_02360 [Rhodobacteraceae bacterium EhC02]
MTEVHFNTTATFDREFFWEGGNSVRYLVARLKADHAKEKNLAAPSPLNIALVIDASGSMAGGKLEAAKEAAMGLAARLTERDRLTVVSFASDVQVHLDAVPVTPENAIQIRAEISRLETRGMTCLSGGWFAGVECAARIAETDERMTPRVIILSDGHANEGITDPEELREHAGELRMRGVLTSTLGIGDGYDEQLLRGIAENGGGRLHDAELTSEISSVLLGELDDIFDTLVEDARIALEMPAGVHVEVVGRGLAELHGGNLVVQMGPIQNGIERVAVFKVTCPKARPGEELEFHLKAEARTVNNRSWIQANAKAAKLVAVLGSTNKAQRRDAQIAEIVARTWSAHIVATAAKMNRDSAYEEAGRYLEEELRFFKPYVEGLAKAGDMIDELEMLAQRVGQRFSPRMHKEMVIQASLAMESRMDRRGLEKAAWSTRMRRGD